MERLQNKNCYVEFNEDKKEIFGRDLTDRYNDPAFYNNSKRGIKKAWQVLTEKFNDNTTMHDSINILYENKIRIHSYCMMD